MNTIIRSMLLLFTAIHGNYARPASGGSYYNNYRGSQSTPSPTPSDEDLCGCYQIDLVCNPPIIGDQICYYYIIEKISDEDYCKPIEYLSLGTGDLNQCGLQSSDIEGLLLEYAPKCYKPDTSYDGSCNGDTNGVPGIKLTFDKEQRDSDGLSIFSLCFDSSSVGGLQENGQIGIKTGYDRYTCDAPNLLPNFCYDTTTTTTTTTTTSEPTFTTCDSTDEIDVAFLLDESGSVDINEWRMIVNLVNKIVINDLSDNSYVSIYEYAALPAFTQILDFTRVGDDRFEPGKVLNNSRYNVAGQTETWDAVNRVLDDFYDYNVAGIDGSNTRNDILFLITDGEPTGTDVCPDMISRMNQSNVDIVIILIDPDGTIDESKVDCLDIRDAKTDIIKLDSFDEDIFYDIQARIRSKTCQDNNPADPGGIPNYGPWDYGNGVFGLDPVPTRAGGGAGGKADPDP